MNLKICQQKLPKLNEKRKTMNRISKNCGPVVKTVALCIMDIPKGEEREKETEKKTDVVIIMAVSFPKLVTDTKPQIQNLR